MRVQKPTLFKRKISFGGLIGEKGKRKGKEGEKKGERRGRRGGGRGRDSEL